VFSATVPASVLCPRGRLKLALQETPAQWRAFLGQPGLLQESQARDARWRQTQAYQEDVARRCGLFNVFCAPHLLLPPGLASYVAFLDRLVGHASRVKDFLAEHPRLAKVSVCVNPAHTPGVPTPEEVRKPEGKAKCTTIPNSNWRVNPVLGFAEVPVTASPADLLAFLSRQGELGLELQARNEETITRRSQLLLAAKRALRLGGLTVADEVTEAQLEACCVRLRFEHIERWRLEHLRRANIICKKCISLNYDHDPPKRETHTR
jgi:hypothetical protein